MEQGLLIAVVLDKPIAVNRTTKATMTGERPLRKPDVRSSRSRRARALHPNTASICETRNSPDQNETGYECAQYCPGCANGRQSANRSARCFEIAQLHLHHGWIHCTQDCGRQKQRQESEDDDHSRTSATKSWAESMCHRHGDQKTQTTKQHERANHVPRVDPVGQERRRAKYPG